ncbi:MAG: CoA transferase [Candidatus Tectomicrobia bacterium]|nr:CoA transferase [Candidatus Tectomicrobia bacterium]
MTKPLDNVKVVDLTRVLAGPFSTMILSDLGAEVIKIEVPEGGDEARGVSPFKGNVSAYFMSINRGKKSVTLNLKDPRGKEIFLKLARWADVVVENFRPGVMEKLGLGYERLKGVNPGLVYAACSGFGQTGPYAQRPAYDMIIQGMSGVISITGEANRPPVRVGVSIGDLAAALYTTVGILTALHERERSGTGQMLDIAMLDALIALLENAIARYDVTGEVPRPMGSRHPSITPFQVFSSQDGYVVLAISSDAQWEKFCRKVGRDDLADDLRFKTSASRSQHADLLIPIVEEIMKGRTTEEWVDEMLQVGVPCGPLHTVDQALNDPHTKARKMLAEVSHPKAGRFRMASNPIKFSKGEIEITKPAPDLGEHTDEILMGILGMTKEEIGTLRNDGVV